MTLRTAAIRYARALLEVASREADIGQAADELEQFAALVDRNPALGRVLLNPAIPAPRKRAAVAELVKQAGLMPVVAKLLVLLAERDRLVLLRDLAAAYREMVLDRQNVVRAEVTTAAALPPEKAQAIERALAGLTGKRVMLGSRVDEALIGGLVARVGGTVYDASVATQLKKIRERLTT